MPTIVAMRLKVENHLITEVESILVPGDDPAVFHAPEKFVEVPRYFTRTIRPAEQNSRYELMAAADAYFRAFQSEGTPDYIRAPLLPSTLRFENGVQATNVDLKVHKATTAAEQFDNAMFKGTKIYDRRYPVVDTETGTVMALVRFHPPNNPARRRFQFSRGRIRLRDFRGRAGKDHADSGDVDSAAGAAAIAVLGSVW